MPNASSFESVRTGTPDTSAGIQIANIPATQSASVEIPMGALAVEALPNAPTPHRTSGGADTGTDMSSAGFGTGTETTLNRGSLVVWVEFDTANAQCSLTPVFYDDDTTPAPQALGPSLSFQASAKRRSATGNYLSVAQIVETYGFRRFKLYKESVSSGTIVVHAVPVAP